MFLKIVELWFFSCQMVILASTLLNSVIRNYMLYVYLCNVCTYVHTSVHICTYIYIYVKEDNLQMVTI